MTEPAKRGVIVSYRECRRCYRVLAETSGDDCPNHALPCCGGKGCEHAPGCTAAPAFQAGQRRAMERERAVLDAFLREPDGTMP